VQRPGSTALLLAAVCSLGCQGDTGHEPPNRPRIGGPISDFPRADLGEDESAPGAMNGSAPPPGVVAPSSPDESDGLAREPPATGDDVPSGSAGPDPELSLDAAVLDLSPADTDADAGVDAGGDTDANADAASDAEPASDDASPQGDASLTCSEPAAACRDSG
jgi:hypothetical protein